jgi:hypothetical protein
LLAGTPIALTSAVVPGLGKTIACVTLNEPIIRLLLSSVSSVRVLAEISAAIKGLRIFKRPFVDLIFIDENFTAFYPSTEFGKRFFIGIFRDTGIEPVIPIVNAADKAGTPSKTV